AEVLEKRRHRVDGNLDKAARLKAEAEAVMAAYEKALAEARHQAQLTMKETTERLAAESAERHRHIAADLARSTAARFTGVEVDAVAAGAAVDEAMRGRA